ncbi:MAG: hypothetical protein IPJ84_05755 [Bdellovibrionales bacterium]|nr:hypothetical protein [Bdellovibrionales bacterium]
MKTRNIMFSYPLSLLIALASVMTPASVAFAGETHAFITSEPGFFAAPMPTIHIDGKVHKMGTFEMGYEVAEAMRSNPVAYEWAKKHEAYSTVSSVALWGSYAAALAYLLSARSDDRNAGGIYWGIIGVGLLTAIGCKKAADAYLYRAINAFNGVSDGSTPPQTKLGIDIVPVRDGASLAMQLEF